MNIGRLLGNLLLGRPGVVFSSDVRIRVEATDRSTYPDASLRISAEDKRLCALTLGAMRCER